MIVGEGNEQYIKLISAGVPLSLYVGTRNKKEYAQSALGTKFFQTEISSSGANVFRKCGFKPSENGTIVETIEEVKSLFTNEYTQIKNDDTPLVKSITKTEVTNVAGSWSNGLSLSDNNLLAVPCENGYAPTVLPSTSTYGLWNIDIDGKLKTYAQDNELGVRCVICLKSNVKYSLVNEIDGVKTWNIEI